jgi:hypothetical protein
VGCAGFVPDNPAQSPELHVCAVTDGGGVFHTRMLTNSTLSAAWVGWGDIREQVSGLPKANRIDCSIELGGRLHVVTLSDDGVHHFIRIPNGRWSATSRSLFKPPGQNFAGDGALSDVAITQCTPSDAPRVFGQASHMGIVALAQNVAYEVQLSGHALLWPGGSSTPDEVSPMWRIDKSSSTGLAADARLRSVSISWRPFSY